MTRRRVLKDLTLGLIYPAVLGTVMYSALQATVGPLMVRIERLGVGATSDLSTTMVLKLGFLTITILFYCFDYMYIMFTKDFDWPFFLCDLGFIAALYVTVYAIDLNAGSANQPRLKLILGCYAFFMLLYLGWDFAERWRCTNTSERRLYLLIIVWELCSLVALGGAMYCLDQGNRALVIGLAILAVITFFFGLFTWRKKEFVEIPAAP